ncbi:D-3-phosphoglycerate dehydrogenase [Candidatus Sulfotelmatomonas gaucii]|uniref:D-3-phosphoglycerate dehydrogenase n=1 Tax=Candidatus Sulfuritelmatomonas gaucii TaxID=2043161 RepID=A0A2N9L861_9BACT|nr:D-3-phosphoglycerate dehydrogenase [Candidatus Sulfotelmatomonas gaucii]
MAELTFGEKLLIARKQLDLYQYEMAERLGVHPNSLTKYERGEGKPHAAVVRMFELLCEQQGIRFDEYKSGEKNQGAAMKIVLAEKVSPATLAVFAAEPGWDVKTHDQLPEGLPAALVDADALVVRSAVQVDDALMEHAPKLRVIGRAGVGVDNIDAEAATRRGIVVMNTPGANAVAVAELTICLMIALARKVPAANATMHAGRWEKKSLQGAELRGKTLGILGLGRVGLEVARRARGFGMEIVGSDPFVPAAVARENGIALVPVEEMFARADYLTLHVGLTPQTQGIINAKTLAAMKKGVRIINCARGELVDEAALVAALKSGQVAGAALDVFSVEPPKESPYFGLDNVILTPHIAGSTAEAQEAVGVQIAQQVREYLKLGVVQNAVNLPSLSHEEYVKMAPYIDLAGRLGSFLAQAGKSGIEAIHLIYGGALCEARTELVRNAAIAGLLQGSENVNRINAAAVAAERGIRVHEEKEESHRGGTATVLTVVLLTASGESRASATVIHGEQPRLLAFDEIDVEAPLEGTLVVCRNLDVPGVIGRIGTILGQQGVNIANFALGRERRAPSIAGKLVKALAVVQVDEPVSESVLEPLKAIEALLEARLVKLPDGK